MTNTEASRPPVQTIVLPLTPTNWAYLEASFPLNEAAWNQMMTTLATMKPALVARPALGGAEHTPEGTEP